MDETESEGVVTAGQRLREAREAKGISLEEIAAQTRIPTRHLASIEVGEWDKLPAATYSIGFAKNYASVVGLDRAEIGEQLRAEMGGSRVPPMNPEVYETVDPARTMPKGLVFGALALLAIFVLAFTWLNNRSLESSAPVAEADNVAAPVENVAAPAAQPTPAATGLVVLTATEAVWLEVRDGPTVLRQGEMTPGQSFEVPANATAPVLTTGKPEALRITVGTTQIPAIGEPGRTVSRVSLKGADLLGTAAGTPAAATPPTQALPPPPQPASRPAAERKSPPAAPTAEPAPILASANGSGSPSATTTEPATEQ